MKAPRASVGFEFWGGLIETLDVTKVTGMRKILQFSKTQNMPAREKGEKRFH